ncbi:MAG: (Fe-S)-binding protein [Deltaproteobacteria bacterium]|nr:(Fe-S)-binding protein [Deltaproteobacteria bacterium]
MSLFDGFHAEKCVLCGQCLHQCPVMSLPIDLAREEVKRLSRGEKTKRALSKCTSCFACNLFCPEGANPAQRILDIWHEKSVHEGLPVRAKYFIPDSPLNFRTYVLEKLPADEKALVESWEDESPCEEVFYPGCNVITVPYLTRTRLLDGVNIRGSLSLCCGETYYRTGQYEMVAKAAARLSAWAKKLRIKKMIVPCTAGMNMLQNVLPKFGVHFDFEVSHMLPWLLARIESGEVKITNPLNQTVTIQESCYAKMFGDEFMDVPRRLLEKMGATVVEEELSRERALCCGIGGGFSHASGYHPLDVTSATIRSLRQAGKTGARAVVVYCAGCLQMLSVGQIVYPNRLPIYHLLELLQIATGEKPERRNKKRARLMFKGVARHQMPKTLSKKRFFMSDLY